MKQAETAAVARNAVIYARYSSHSQTEQSIEGQLRVCHEYARREGFTIVGEYIDRAICRSPCGERGLKWYMDDVIILSDSVAPLAGSVD